MERTVFAEHALLPDGWARDVLIAFGADGRIADVSTGASAQARERQRFIVPGLANLHSHAFQRAFSGLTERRGASADSFWSWREAMYRHALAMSPEATEAVAAMAYIEMLEAGFTRVGEFHYLHHDPEGAAYADRAEMGARIAAACAETGLGLTLLPVFYAHSGFDYGASLSEQRRFISTLDDYAKLHAASRQAIAGLPTAVLGIAPHSLRAASVAEIGALLDLAGDGPIHIHVAEQVREVEDCLAATGQRPAAHLLDALDVGARWCLIHATHLDADEIAGIAASGAVAGLCPVTEANLGDGIFPAPQFLAAGGRCGVGTDSNVRISASGELRQLEYSQRLVSRARNVVAAPMHSTGQTLFAQAAAGGAQALGWETGIAAGRPADLVAIEAPDAPHLGPETILDGWIFGTGARVADVWTAGEKRVSAGRHVARDAVRDRFIAAMEMLAET
ncbi:formimidoylglutamate deiminase [Pelagibacterium montanilacus]|uniref:formimidoylglutamate deiminase n=1 Tax=Pelagibacterium montanilacus TaxID=2185280 RepID=UPI000F8EF179|nr:formimidoylglutamate deiminase [Pelagibacterium montanilacus]